MESYIIIHKDYGCRVCNICNDAELDKDHYSGVCNMCTDNRLKDGIWTAEQGYSDQLRTDENGTIINY
jgi:hypothetical protein